MIDPKIGTYFMATAVAFSLVSCEYFTPKSESNPIAQVNDVYLYKEDVATLTGKPIDEIKAIPKDVVQNWAKQELLFQQAKQNLSPKDQQHFNDLVKQYQHDLYVNAYLNKYVQQKMNTTVTEAEVLKYYEAHQELFVLPETLLRFSYIKLPVDFKDTSLVKKMFKNFKEEDQDNLDNLYASFVEADFGEDTPWRTMEELYLKLPKLKEYHSKDFLKKNNVFAYNAPDGKYLFKLDAIRYKDQQSPIDYVEDDIKQIILNKRKIKIQNKLEIEILKDAQQTQKFKQFEN